MSTPVTRYASVDALRGLTVAAMLLVNDAGDWGHVYAPLEHAAWNGCTFADLIFPVFLFIVGVSITLGLGARTTAQAVLVRALRLVALGLVLHVVAHLAMGTASFRVMGVLQRIGLCYAAAALLALHTSPRTQWAVFGAILIGYALLLFAAPMTKDANLASRLDTLLLGRHAYEFDTASGRGHDPEGILSTVPALATTLLGVRCGAWLQRGARRTMIAASLAALALGALAAVVQPFNKQLWTPAYVLWTGGIAIAVLLLAHELVDRHGVPAIGRSLGINAITAYALAWLAVCALEGSSWGAPLYRTGFGWIVPRLGPEAASLAYALAFVALVWAAMGRLARRGVRIRI
jgi:predicted acyltransferase